MSFQPTKSRKSSLSLKASFQRYGKVLQESPTCRTRGVHQGPTSGTFLRTSSLDAGGQRTEPAAPGLCRVFSLLYTLLSTTLCLTVSCSHDTFSSFSICKTINYLFFFLHTKGSFPIFGGRHKHFKQSECLTHDSHCLMQDLPQYPKHKFLPEQC